MDFDFISLSFEIWVEIMLCKEIVTVLQLVPEKTEASYYCLSILTIMKDWYE